MGGLGNQMFQYALYRTLLAKGEYAYMDISDYKQEPIHNGYELPRVFNVKERIASSVDIKRLRKHIKNMRIYERVVRKVKLLLSIMPTHVTEKEFFRFNPRILNLKRSHYLDGYWQTEKYFKEIEQIIRQEFHFKQTPNSKEQKLLDKIAAEKSISIHVRRGDYVNHPLHGNVCTLDYYRQAIEIIRSKVHGPVFYIFSDDIEWCKKHFDFIDAIFIDSNTKKDGYKDLQLIASCKHNIIANSSFSWWGGWLNENPNKIVIAPNKWLNRGDLDYSGAVPDRWIKISINESYDKFR